MLPPDASLIASPPGERIPGPRTSRHGASAFPRTREAGVTLLLAVVSLVFVIPMVGLAIDVGYLYAVKTRLQASVDGAALAAARALVLGQNTVEQSAAAQQNAVNWFYANFPAGNWGTHDTTMTTGDVEVFDDTTNPNLRNVIVTATTEVPTFFMRWLHFDSTNLAASGHASRRDVVIMIVLDRSGSMQASPGACEAMKEAAKLFTGQFAPGRDRIGLLSFSTSTYVHSAPDANFQSVLGYSSTLGSGTGEIDTVQCTGGTSTAQAISVAHNELYKLMQPGALNLILLETDGLPNSLTMRWFDYTVNEGLLSGNSNCRDANGLTPPSGWSSAGSERDWMTRTFSFGVGSLYPDVPSGAYGMFYSGDDASSPQMQALFNPWGTDGYSGSVHLGSSAPGCKFAHNITSVTDFKYMPPTDLFGNEIDPVNAYRSVSTTSNGRLIMEGLSTADRWENFRNAAFNATDNAAYRVRTNTDLPAYIFAIGLGGSTVPPDYTLLQRIANDPNGDMYNTPALYGDCALNADCIHYPDQPSSQFIFSTDQNSLRQAFLSLSSQILRLSQ